jgi:hypothetical protein
MKPCAASTLEHTHTHTCTHKHPTHAHVRTHTCVVPPFGHVDHRLAVRARGLVQCRRQLLVRVQLMLRRNHHRLARCCGGVCVVVVCCCVVSCFVLCCVVCCIVCVCCAERGFVRWHRPACRRLCGRALGSGTRMAAVNHPLTQKHTHTHHVRDATLLAHTHTHTQNTRTRTHAHTHARMHAHLLAFPQQVCERCLHVRDVDAPPRLLGHALLGVARERRVCEHNQRHLSACVVGCVCVRRVWDACGTCVRRARARARVCWCGCFFGLVCVCVCVSRQEVPRRLRCFLACLLACQRPTTRHS